MIKASFKHSPHRVAQGHGFHVIWELGPTPGVKRERGIPLKGRSALGTETLTEIRVTVHVLLLWLWPSVRFARSHPSGR